MAEMQGVRLGWPHHRLRPLLLHRGQPSPSQGPGVCLVRHSHGIVRHLGSDSRPAGLGASLLGPRDCTLGSWWDTACEAVPQAPGDHHEPDVF